MINHVRYLKDDMPICDENAPVLVEFPDFIKQDGDLDGTHCPKCTALLDAANRLTE